MTDYICDCEELALPREDYCESCNQYKKLEAQRDVLFAKLHWIADQEQTARDCMNSPGTFAVVLATYAAAAIRELEKK